MRHKLKIGHILPVMLLASGVACAQARIGLSVPLGETAPRLAAQMRAGAQAAADALGAELVVADDQCSEEGGRASAERFVEEEVKAVVGYLCTEAVEAALPALTEAGIPVIATGIRTDSLTDRRERTGWSVFRLGPRADAERDAAARYVFDNWRGSLFAIIDDGTIYGREIAETVRIAAEESGLSPAFIDTFRPQLDNQIGLIGRLRRSGASHVFVGGDRADIAIIARDAAGLDFSLNIAGGEALRAPPGDVELAEGVVMIAATDWSEGEQEGYYRPTYAAVEIAVEAAGSDDLAAALADGTFETVIGSVSFDAKGDMEGVLYQPYRFDGSHFIPVD